MNQQMNRRLKLVIRMSLLALALTLTASVGVWNALGSGYVKQCGLYGAAKEALLTSGFRFAPPSRSYPKTRVNPGARAALTANAALALGSYPNTTVNLGGNGAITPSAAPTDTTNINVGASTNFKGTFAADPVTGIVRVTNAHPAGVYKITVKAFGISGTTTKTFTLTVQNGSLCNLPTFTNAADVGVGATPYSAAVGDFNGDGIQDLAIANSSSNTVSIRLGNGAGGFSGTTNISVGAQPRSVAVGDFNGDGKQDLATANFGANTVSIRLGDGAGGFSGTTNFSAGNAPISVAVGDFNGDGKQDLVTANSSIDRALIHLGNGAGGFSSTTSILVGTFPSSVAVGDFNGDGKQDLAVASSLSNIVSIRLGDGAGGFSGTTAIVVGASPQSVAVGDFNGDGKQDLATANSGANNVSIRLGDGAGGFSGTTAIGVGAQPQSVAVGDFNGDGKQDLATANFGANTVSIRLGNGAGGFSGTASISVGASPRSVAVGDFNGDGIQDLAIANSGANTVSIRLGGCGTPPTISAAGPLTRQQGSPAISSQIATVSDAEQAANTLTVTATLLTGSGVTVSGISVDSNGVVSASVAAGCAATNSTFTLKVTDNAGATATATLTVNVIANPQPTLSYANQSAPAGGGLTINPTTATDNGGIASFSLLSQGTYTGGIAVNSATGEVKISNAKPGGSHSITIRATDNCGATRNATFTLTVTCPTITVNPSTLPSSALGAAYTTNITASGGTPGYLFVVTSGSLPPGLTLNSNGKLSGAATASGSYNFTVKATDANGCSGSRAYTLTIVPPPTLGAYPNTTVGLGANGAITPSAAPTDTTNINVGASTNFKGTFAADPVTGIVRVTNAHPAGVYKITVKAFGISGTTTKTFTLTVQNGSLCNLPTFTNAADVGVGATPYSAAVGDFNGDGIQDLAIANSSSNTVSIRLGNGAGGFSGTTNISVGAQPRSVAVGDFNGDGKQDLATANFGANTVSIRLGDGAGGFSGTTNFSAGNAPISVAVGDFNGDGKQDLVTANSSIDRALIHLGNGAGGFSSTTSILVGTFPSSVAVGDFNGDGKQDLAVASSLSNIVSIRLGDGAGGFSGTTAIVVGASPQSVAVGDFNGDGKQDLATANSGANNVSIRLGDGAGGFSGTTNINVGAQPRSVAVGDFNGDGKQDLATANFGANTVSIRLGNGAGGFSGTTNISVGAGPRSVAVGDFNGDGIQDLAIANSGANTVSIRLGGCGTPPTISAAGPLTRQQGSPAISSQIATVSDANQTANTLTVTATLLTGSGVTVSGWIVSPAGAYPSNPALTGKANFGFVSKYKKGNNVQTGETEFQFDLASLHFRSTVYEWLVVSGARAQYKGAGTINDAGDYRFILTAIDGQRSGGDGQDKFRIKIWNNANGAVVYDNQMSAPDDADPVTVIGGGQIVIHTGGNGANLAAQAAGESESESQAGAAEIEWQIIIGSEGEQQSALSGGSGAPYFDVIVPGDYDGDGVTDLGVFRRATGHWLIKRSTDGGLTQLQWGAGSDLPVAADYDGDGKTDIAVWRGATGQWLILRSSDGKRQVVVWGAGLAPFNDVPAPADYDGDGKADIAVWRASEGKWYALGSASNSVIIKTENAPRQ